MILPLHYTKLFKEKKTLENLKQTKINSNHSRTYLCDKNRTIQLGAYHWIKIQSKRLNSLIKKMTYKDRKGS